MATTYHQRDLYTVESSAEAYYIARNEFDRCQLAERPRCKRVMSKRLDNALEILTTMFQEEFEVIPHTDIPPWDDDVFGNSGIVVRSKYVIFENLRPSCDMEIPYSLLASEKYYKVIYTGISEAHYIVLSPDGLGVDTKAGLFMHALELTAITDSEIVRRVHFPLENLVAL